MSAHKTRSAPGCDLLRIDAKALRHFVPRQHSLCTQPLETTLQFMFDRHASDHATGEWLDQIEAGLLRVVPLADAEREVKSGFEVVSPDYTVRPEPSETVATLEELTKGRAKLDT
jgi:hypothetical protein